MKNIPGTDIKLESEYQGVPHMIHKRKSISENITCRTPNAEVCEDKYGEEGKGSGVDEMEHPRVMNRRGGKRCTDKRTAEKSSITCKTSSKDGSFTSCSLRASGSIAPAASGKRIKKGLGSATLAGSEVEMDGKKKSIVRYTGNKLCKGKLKEEKDRQSETSLRSSAPSLHNDIVQNVFGEQHGLSALLIAEDPYSASCSLLELSLARASMIDIYFYVVDNMMLAVPTAKGEEEKLALLDAHMYKWMTQDRYPKYEDRFTVAERGVRQDVLSTYYQKRRTDHRKALDRLYACSNESSYCDVVKEPVLLSASRSTCSSARGNFSETRLTTQRSTTRSAHMDAQLPPDVWIDTWLTHQQPLVEKVEVRCSQMEFLRSSVVHMSPAVDWSPREIALFQLALYNHGPDFYAISKSIGTKSFKEAYSFYTAVFKQTLRYKIFKEFKKYTQWWHVLQ